MRAFSGLGHGGRRRTCSSNMGMTGCDAAVPEVRRSVPGFFRLPNACSGCWRRVKPSEVADHGRGYRGIERDEGAQDALPRCWARGDAASTRCTPSLVLWHSPGRIYAVFTRSVRTERASEHNAPSKIRQVVDRVRDAGGWAKCTAAGKAVTMADNLIVYIEC